MNKNKTQTTITLNPNQKRNEEIMRELDEVPTREHIRQIEAKNLDKQTKRPGQNRSVRRFKTTL